MASTGQEPSSASFATSLGTGLPNAMRRRIKRMPCCSCGRHHPQDRAGKSGHFKPLRDASDVQHPSLPSQLYLAITSIFSFSVCKVKEFLQPNQSYINVQIGPSPTAALNNSGADISGMLEAEFQRIPVDIRPKKIFCQMRSPCLSARGSPLTVTGIYNFPISVLGRKTKHPF
jgi:hypothetical protein